MELLIWNNTLDYFHIQFLIVQEGAFSRMFIQSTFFFVKIAKVLKVLKTYHWKPISFLSKITHINTI